MAIADHDFALEKLREFLELLVKDEQVQRAGRQPPGEARHLSLQPLVEKIAREIDPGSAAKLGSAWSNGLLAWSLEGAIATTVRLIGILEGQDDYERIFGPVGPTLAANRLHPWVWGAAANLWDDGHYIAAVDAAAKKVELQTQKKLRASKRRSGADLFAQAFSLDDPKPDSPRLRFPDIDRAEAQETWNSAHMGAQHLGMGCVKGIRNPLAHPSEDTGEIGEDEKQEALEQLAALSVLARWVDACEVDRAE